MPSSADPGSRVKHKDECGVGKRGAGGHGDYMGTNNPFTMLYPSGFRSAPQNLSMVWNIPEVSGLVPPGDRRRLALYPNCSVEANILDLIQLMTGDRQTNFLYFQNTSENVQHKVLKIIKCGV